MLRFTSDRKTLLNVIMPALSASSGRSTLPALEGLVFEVKENATLKSQLATKILKIKRRCCFCLYECSTLH